MIGGQNELSHGMGRAGKTCRPVEQVLLVGAALGQGGVSVKDGRGFRAGGDDEGFAWPQRYLQLGQVEVVFGHIALAAKLLDAQEEVLVPVELRRHLRPIAQQVERPRAVEHRDSQAVVNVLDLGGPVVDDGRAVIVTVVAQGLDRQAHRPGGARQAVLDVGGVRAGLHPDALFQQGVGDGVGPDGRRALQVEAVEQMMTVALERAVFPAVGVERVETAAIGVDAVVLDRLVELGQEQRAAERRLERGHEQTVVTPRQHAGDGAAGKAADTVGDQPLPPGSHRKIAAHLAAEV